MSKTRLLFAFAVLLLFAFAFSGLAVAQAPAGSRRPAEVPADYLITPFGYFHQSCVVHLANGDEIRSDEHVIRHTNGSSDNIQACAHPHYRADGEKVIGDERGITDPNISHAWIEYAGVYNTASSYGELIAKWSVPYAPTSLDGQTLYFFPGVEDILDVVTIIQPVLGFNSDYANAWGIASWNCCVTGTTFEAPPQHASPGDTILGYMFDTCAAGTKTCSSWNVVTWDIQSGNFSQLLNTSNFGQTFNWAFGGVLEVYNIAQCSDYPSHSGYPGTTEESFHELQLFTDKFVQIVSPAWKIVNLSSGLTPQCSYGGSKPQQVILTF